MQGFLLFLIVSLAGAGSSPEYFYKNKFPGYTCVPLSFYISTQLGTEKSKGFWKTVKGANDEEKFENFLDECTYHSNPSLREVKKTKIQTNAKIQKDFKLSDQEALFDFFNSWSDSELWRELNGFLPMYSTVQNSGMWLDDLLSVIQKMNPEYVKDLKLETEEFSMGKQLATPSYARLYFLKKSLERSLQNSFFPVIAWNNLYRDSKLQAWQRWGGHAVTITSIDEVERSVFDTRLNFTYIDNEDGLEYKAFFYVLGEETLKETDEFDPKAFNQIHVSMSTPKINRLYTLNAVIVSKL